MSHINYAMKAQFYFLLLPCVAGFFWFLAYLLFTPKGAVYRKLTRFLAITSLFLLFALLSQNENGRLMLHFILFKQVAALLMIPSFIAYIKSLTGERPSGILYLVLSVVPYVQLIVGIESVFSVGYENAVRVMVDSFTFQGPMFPYLSNNAEMVFYAGYTYMFKAFLLADFFMFSIGVMSCAISGACNIQTVGSFLFRGKKAPLKPVQYFLALLLFLVVVTALILGKASITENPILVAVGSIFIAVDLSLIAFVGTVGSADKRSIPGILRSVRFGVDDDPDPILTEEEFAAKIADNKSNAPSVATDGSVEHVPYRSREDEQALIRVEIASKLAGIVEGEELFLKRDLTLTAVADRLGVFKDDLADYIDYKYGMSFQNYINMLRINYAEKYIMTHDRVTQNDIALACGFSGASSFNTAFSKKNGVTPKIWKDRQLEMLKNQEA